MHNMRDELGFAGLDFHCRKYRTDAHLAAYKLTHEMQLFHRLPTADWRRRRDAHPAATSFASESCDASSSGLTCIRALECRLLQKKEENYACEKHMMAVEYEGGSEKESEKEIERESE